jgi:hypothetical protein
VEDAHIPAWIDDSRWYYTAIEGDSSDPVFVYALPDDQDEVSPDSPGTLCLRLEPRFHYSPRMRVLGPDGGEHGVIRRVGPVPFLSYAMYRGDSRLWKLSVRSVFRHRYELALAHGDPWWFDTPWFTRLKVTGNARGAPRLLGCIGPSTRYWLMRIEPGWDAFHVLAAVAFLHRQWWHS